MEAPILEKPIPPQVVNEQAAYGPFNLREFFKTQTDDEEIYFRAEIKGGAALPKGMICTADGLLTGIPAKETQGNYEIVLSAHNKVGTTQTTFVLTIKPSLATNESVYVDQLKAQVWQALEQRLPVPDIGELYDRPINILEIYYLLERWSLLKVWDAFNLDPPGELHPLTLEGASPHFHVFDRGSCIVMCPKDLFSHERTLEDGLQTARAVAREVYKRGWTLELVGFDKYSRALWIELQHLADKFGKRMEVINYAPSTNDLKVYNTQATIMRMGIE